MDVHSFLAKHPEWRKCPDLVVFPPSWPEAIEAYPELETDDLRHVADQLSSFGVTRLALYMSSRMDGNSHRFAKMIATQRGPALKTDSVFFTGAKRLAEQDYFTTPQQLEKVISIARANGYNPLSTDTYVPELARFQGDPEAFVSATGGRNHIRRVCEKRGWQCDGDVTTPYCEPESDPHETGVKLHPELVNKGVQRLVARDPSLKKKSRAELRSMALAKYGPSS